MRSEIDRILSKESLVDADINLLAKNMGLLTESEKVRLGFITSPVVIAKVEEVIKEVVEPVVKVKKSSKK